MSGQEIPPLLKEKLARYDQLQQNLQAILLQKQQLELELAEIERALTELKKILPKDAVYKSAGNLLIRANRDNVIQELEERKELANTRSMVLSKQESRIRENVKDIQSKIDEAVRGRSPPTAQ